MSVLVQSHYRQIWSEIITDHLFWIRTVGQCTLVLVVGNGCAVEKSSICVYVYVFVILKTHLDGISDITMAY